MKTKVYPFSWVDWTLLACYLLAMALGTAGVIVLLQEVSR